MPTTVQSSKPPRMQSEVQAPEVFSSNMIRLGAVAYLNTKPLIYGLEQRLRGIGHLSLELPSRLATQMHEGLLDIGLIPVVEYLRNRAKYRLISDAGIACQGPVWSVRVLFRVPPHRVKTLGTDEGSRTSVALCQVLFASQFGRLPELVPFPIGSQPQDCPADAVLVIGDRAMNPERYRSDFFFDWDLGQRWFENTGLPFVFAMWVARGESSDPSQMIQILESSRDAGCQNIEKIIATYASSYGLTDQACREYLTEYLRFKIGSQELRGLDEYARRCDALGLI